MKNLGNDIAVDQKRPERATATSPRQRLGGRNGSKPTPYRGKSFCTFSASSLTRPSPRAMPWAMSGLALQAALNLKGSTAILLPKKWDGGVCTSVDETLCEPTILVNSAVAEEWPPAPHLLRALQVNGHHLNGFFFYWSPIEELSLWANHH